MRRVERWRRPVEVSSPHGHARAMGDRDLLRIDAGVGQDGANFYVVGLHAF
jgi:hypothetical protein